MGMHQDFWVTPGTQPPITVALGETDPTHMFIDMSQAYAPEGPVSFIVTNEGTETHEFVVLQTDTPAADFPIVGFEGEQNRFDEDAKGLTNVGETGDGWTPGTCMMLTIDMTDGHYAVVCNLPGHYAHGDAPGPLGGASTHLVGAAIRRGPQIACGVGPTAGCRGNATTAWRTVVTSHSATMAPTSTASIVSLAATIAQIPATSATSPSSEASTAYGIDRRSPSPGTYTLAARFASLVHPSQPSANTTTAIARVDISVIAVSDCHRANTTTAAATNSVAIPSLHVRRMVLPPSSARQSRTASSTRQRGINVRRVLPGVRPGSTGPIGREGLATVRAWRDHVFDFPV